MHYTDIDKNSEIQIQETRPSHRSTLSYSIMSSTDSEEQCEHGRPLRGIYHITETDELIVSLNNN